MHPGDATAGFRSSFLRVAAGGARKKEVIVNLIEVDSYIGWETYLKDIEREIHRTHSYSHLSKHPLLGIASIMSIYTLMLTLQL